MNICIRFGNPSNGCHNISRCKDSTQILFMWGKDNGKNYTTSDDSFCDLLWLLLIPLNHLTVSFVSQSVTEIQILGSPRIFGGIILAPKEKSGESKVIWIHPLGTMIVCTKFYDNPSASCWHILVWAIVVDWLNKLHCIPTTRMLMWLKTKKLKSEEFVLSAKVLYLAPDYNVYNMN